MAADMYLRAAAMYERAAEAAVAQAKVQAGLLGVAREAEQPQRLPTQEAAGPACSAPAASSGDRRVELQLLPPPPPPPPEGWDEEPQQASGWQGKQAGGRRRPKKQRTHDDPDRVSRAMLAVLRWGKVRHIPASDIDAQGLLAVERLAYELKAAHRDRCGAEPSGLGQALRTH